MKSLCLLSLCEIQRERRFVVDRTGAAAGAFEVNSNLGIHGCPFPQDRQHVLSAILSQTQQIGVGQLKLHPQGLAVPEQIRHTHRLDRPRAGQHQQQHPPRAERIAESRHDGCEPSVSWDALQAGVTELSRAKLNARVRHAAASEKDLEGVFPLRRRRRSCDRTSVEHCGRRSCHWTPPQQEVHIAHLATRSGS